MYRIDKRKFLARFGIDIKNYVLEKYKRKNKWRMKKMEEQLKKQEKEGDRNLQDFLEMDVVSIMNTQMQNYYYQKVIAE